MLIISYLDKAFPSEGSCCTAAAHLLSSAVTTAAPAAALASVPGVPALQHPFSEYQLLLPTSHLGSLHP